jgi:hypothetical protein
MGLLTFDLRETFSVKDAYRSLSRSRRDKGSLTPLGFDLEKTSHLNRELKPRRD